MNKTEFIESMTESGEMTKKDAAVALDNVLETIKKELANGEKINFVGFGIFEPKERGERKGRNPQTGEEIIIPPSKYPAFKAGKSLKQALK